MVVTCRVPFVLPVVRAEYFVLLTQSLTARLLRNCLCWIADPHTCTRYNAFLSKDSNSIRNVPRTLVACFRLVRLKVLGFTPYRNEVQSAS
jgi:hypothetical protein